ncbi:hypothetical protein AL520_14590 [Achromobacter xylosoxidans]|nr:hypothetical protein AL520_14590 [Achromobacter xylosoxidans]
MADPTFFDLFEIPWAESGNADVITLPQYKAGWAYIGSLPPTVEQFNKIQQLTDQKLAWLFSQIKTVAGATGQEVDSNTLDVLLHALTHLDMANATKGILSVARGGTGTGSIGSGEFLIGNADGTLDRQSFNQAVKAILDARNATLLVSGLVKLATAEEIALGADNSKAITSAGLRSKTQSTQTDTTPGQLLTVGSFGLGFDAFLGENQDLDSVVTPGLYGQNVSAYAKRSLHYPIEGGAGTLLVQSAGPIKTQVYVPFISGTILTRTRNASGAWSEDWERGIRASDTATDAVAGILRMATIPEAVAMLNNGVALTPATLVSAFLGGGNASISSDGYQKLPSGLIIQQMAAPATVNAAATAVFPKAFPNACFKVWVGESNSVEWWTDNITVYGSFSPTKTGVGIAAYRWNGSGFAPANGALANVLAIGW